MKKNYIYASLLGVFGSLGFTCLLDIGAIIALELRTLYPQRYPFDITVGLTALVICVVLFALYMYGFAKLNAPSLKKLGVSALITFGVFAVFCVVWAFMFELASGVSAQSVTV